MNARKLYLIVEERNKIVARLGNYPGVSCRAVTSVVRNLLLNAPYFYNGRHIQPKAKSLGAGVWEVTNEFSN